MNKSAGLVQTTDNTLQLQGTVNLHTANSLLEDIRLRFVHAIDTLDCSGVREADSAAVSLLLACMRLAHERGRTLRISGMGEQLLNLVHLYEVETLLQSSLV